MAKIKVNFKRGVMCVLCSTWLSTNAKKPVCHGCRKKYYEFKNGRWRLK